MTVLHAIVRYLHISMGTLGILSGAAAMLARKGSRVHRWAGNVFFVSMLLMAAAGTTSALSFVPNAGNAVGGALTFYLVATAWATVARAPRTIGRFEIAAALFGLAIATTDLTIGFIAQSRPKHLYAHYPSMLYFIFGSAALLATLFDVRMIARGGLGGASRTTRHLIRMCTSMFIATGSLFLGQAKMFPPSVRASGVLRIPVYLVLGGFLYSFIRVRVWPSVRARYRRFADAAPRKVASQTSVT